MNKVQTSGQGCQAATFDTPSSTGFAEVSGLAGGAVSAAIALLATWQDRWMQRRNLSQLDSRMLRDIGLDPYEARREARKPFWAA